MLGYKLIRVQDFVVSTIRENALLMDKHRAELEHAQQYIGRLEREVEFYRQRYDEALQRADSQLDGMLQQQGFAAVTPTTKREQTAAEKKQAEATEQHEAELIEMFAESIGQMEEYDELTLPSELRVEAAKLIATKK